MVGPKSMFWKCRNPITLENVSAIWTGTKRQVHIPESSWYVNPISCNQTTHFSPYLIFGMIIFSLFLISCFVVVRRVL